MLMTHGFPLLEGGWESGHGLYPSDPEKWKSVVMATDHPSPRRKEGRKPWTLPLSSREVEKHDGEHPHTISKRKEGKQQWSLPFSSWEVGGCCHGHPTSLFQKEKVEEAMTFAHLLFCAYDPWPSSPRGKEGRQPWSLPF